MKTLNALKTFLVIVSLATGATVLTSGCAHEDRTHETTGEGVNDTEITSHVSAALAAIGDYKFSEVQVATFKGKVQLSGFVDTGSHKDQAATLAKQVEGVKDVINNITVK